MYLGRILVSAELGDYDEEEHTPGFISEFRFVPESQQTEVLELAVLEAFKTRKYVAAARRHATRQRAKRYLHSFFEQGNPSFYRRCR